MASQNVPSGLQRLPDAGHPFPIPLDVLLAVPLVVVDVVLVADVERRVGKGQIDAAGLDLSSSSMQSPWYTLLAANPMIPAPRL